jgi:hypothetical protein
LCRLPPLHPAMGALAISPPAHWINATERDRCPDRANRAQTDGLLDQMAPQCRQPRHLDISIGIGYPTLQMLDLATARLHIDFYFIFRYYTVREELLPSTITRSYKMSTDIPIIDFERATSSPGQLAADLLTACTEWGTPVAAHDTKGAHTNVSQSQVSFLSRTIR